MGQICSVQPGSSRVDVITAIYQPATANTTTGAHVIISSSKDLQQLLSAQGIDHTFLVQPNHACILSSALDAACEALNQPSDSSIGGELPSLQQNQQSQGQAASADTFEAIFKMACMLLKSQTN